VEKFLSKKMSFLADTKTLTVGSLVCTSEYCDAKFITYEVVIDVYDDIIFHTLDDRGQVMPYNASDVISVLPHGLAISAELASIREKLKKINHNGQRETASNATPLSSSPDRI
jgi:hypothetical protein